MADTPKGWDFERFDQAWEAARQSQKPIFLYFGRHGCPSCEKTNLESFSDPRVKKRFNAHYELAYADSESGERLRFPNGERITEMELGVKLKVFGTPLFYAVWLDKRNPSSGYAVWGALSTDAGKSFAAWDDAREAWGDASESGDVLLSWNWGKGWSPDLLVLGASGTGYQGSPAITLDPQGDLHLVWIERDDLSSASRARSREK